MRAGRARSVAWAARAEAAGVAMSHGGVQRMEHYHAFHGSRSRASIGRFRFRACGLGRSIGLLCAGGQVSNSAITLLTFPS